MRPDEKSLFDRVLAADHGAGTIIDMAPALAKMPSERLYHLVHKWEREGLVDLEREWTKLQLTYLGRELAEER